MKRAGYLVNELSRFYEPAMCFEKKIEADMSKWQMVVKMIRCPSVTTEEGDPLDVSIFLSDSEYSIEIYSSHGYYLGPEKRQPESITDISMEIAHLLIEPVVREILGLEIIENSDLTRPEGDITEPVLIEGEARKSTRP
jgi:hypothetical protein